MEAVSLKLGDSFLKDMEKAMKKHRYSTKTEFIREAIREKLRDLEKEEALMRVRKLYGAGTGKRKITDADIHRAGEEVFKEFEKKFR